MLAAAVMASDKDGNPQRIGMLVIQNDRSGDRYVANYNVEWKDEETGYTQIAKVKNYERMRGALNLIKVAIEAIQRA